MPTSWSRIRRLFGAGSAASSVENRVRNVRNTRYRSNKVGVRFNLSTKEQHKSSWVSLLALCGAAAAVCGALVLAFDRKEPSPAAAAISSPNAILVEQSASYSGRFEKCGRIRSTCVVDGDTLWLNGVKIRIADIDTPEISKPQCQAEYELGMRATHRLIELLNEGEFNVATTTEWGDEDRYGRKLRLIVRNGQSVGDRLVREGFAHRWEGHKVPWC